MQNNQEEIILHDDKDFLICIDQGMTTDLNRFLIVYKDQELHSIRNLEGCHVSLLLRSYEAAKKCIEAVYDSCGPPPRYSIYFNYLPSVYQLHAHVVPHENKIHLRSHNILRVVKNLYLDDHYYKKALILTRIAKSNPLFSSYMQHKIMSSDELEKRHPKE